MIIPFLLIYLIHLKALLLKLVLNYATKLYLFKFMELLRISNCSDEGVGLPFRTFKIQLDYNMVKGKSVN